MKCTKVITSYIWLKNTVIEKTNTIFKSNLNIWLCRYVGKIEQNNII